MEPAEEQAVTAEFSGKQVASPVVTKVYSREVLRPSTRVADMAELLGDLYQGDSWNYPVRYAKPEESLLSMFSVLRTAYTELCWPIMQGMKDTQILHTTSDVSSDSPSHAKVEEQSSFKVYSEKMLSRGRLTSALRSSFDILVCFTVDAAYWRFKRLTRSKITHHSKSGNT